MISYLELVKPELLIALGTLVVGFVGLGIYAVHKDNKREREKHRPSH